MKKLCAALLFLLCASAAQAENTVGPGAQILCNKSAFVTPATATTTALVSGIAGQSIFICGWHVTSTQTASSTFQFVSGVQGGPCTSPVNLTPAFSVTNTAPSADHISLASIQVVQGAQLCVATTGATVAESILVYYSQF